MKSKFRSRLIGAVMALGLGALAFAGSTGTAAADYTPIPQIDNNSSGQCMTENGFHMHVSVVQCGNAFAPIATPWGRFYLDGTTFHVHSNAFPVTGNCLSAVSGEVHVNAVIDIEACDATRPDQKLTIGSNNSLALVDWPGLCIEDTNSWVTIHYCNGSPAQRWNFVNGA